jgi:hypothetical protein
MFKRLSASLSALVLLTVFAASSVTAAVPTPGETFPGNYQCPEGALGIDPVESGTYNLPDGGTITITVHSTAAGQTFDFVTDGATIDSIVVKGGPNYHWYTWVPGVDAAEGLHAPLNLNNGKWYGLSHLCIESTKKDDPEPPKK